jgi:predicted alpha/beta hydrolase family esterase
MPNVFIIHGAYGSNQENWIPWLVDELTKEGVKVTAPNFPTPRDQSYDSWLNIILPYSDCFDAESILVGHSIGAAFALCVLEKIDVTIDKTILVSGFLGSLNNPDFDLINKSISGHQFNWSVIKANSRHFQIIHGIDDPYVPPIKSQELSTILGVPAIKIPNGGHLNEQAGFREFPILLDLVR